MPVAFERVFRISYDECDLYGHVNHANYLRFMQEAAFNASAVVSYDFQMYEQNESPLACARNGITFLRPLVYGDEAVSC